jgi:hypothetical protein
MVTCEGDRERTSSNTGDRWVDDHITTSKCSGMKSDCTIVFYGI